MCMDKNELCWHQQYINNCPEGGVLQHTPPSPVSLSVCAVCLNKESHSEGYYNRGLLLLLLSSNPRCAKGIVSITLLCSLYMALSENLRMLFQQMNHLSMINLHDCKVPLPEKANHWYISRDHSKVQKFQKKVYLYSFYQ